MSGVGNTPDPATEPVDLLALAPRILNQLEMWHDVVEIRTGKSDPDLSDLIGQLREAVRRG